MWISSKAYFKSFETELQSCFYSLYGKFSSLKVESHLDLLKEEGLTLGNWPNDNFRLITKLFQNSTQPCFWPEIPSDQINWTSQGATKNCPRRPPQACWSVRRTHGQDGVPGAGNAMMSQFSIHFHMGLDLRQVGDGQEFFCLYLILEREG